MIEDKIIYDDKDITYMVEKKPRMKHIKIDMDEETYIRFKNELFKRGIYTYKEFMEYLFKLMEKEDELLNAKSSNCSNQAKEESKAKEVKDSKEQAKGMQDHADHDTHHP